MVRLTQPHIPHKHHKEYNKKIPEECIRHFIHDGFLDVEDVEHVKSGCHSTAIVLAVLHNETINIYTHLIPIFVIFIELFCKIWFTETHIVINSYGISMMLCFILSVHYHIGCCRTPSDYKRLLQVDLFGVYLIFFVSVLAGNYVGWQCLKYHQFIYCVINCFFFGFILFPMLFIYGHSVKFFYKKLCFALLLVCELIPMCHWIVLYFDLLKMFWYGPLFMFGGYFIGGIIWHYRVPERFWPGKFDIFGHSHQWWHICIVIASFSWWYMLNDLDNHWQTTHCNDLM